MFLLFFFNYLSLFSVCEKHRSVFWDMLVYVLISLFPTTNTPLSLLPRLAPPMPSVPSSFLAARTHGGRGGEGRGVGAGSAPPERVPASPVAEKRAGQGCRGPWAPCQRLHAHPQPGSPCPSPYRLVGFFVKHACAKRHLRACRGRTGPTPDFLKEFPEDL